MNIQTEHMKRRCYFISAICGMSLYTWYNYSLFDPINNSFFNAVLSKLFIYVILFRLGYISHNNQSCIIQNGFDDTSLFYNSIWF